MPALLTNQPSDERTKPVKTTDHHEGAEQLHASGLLREPAKPADAYELELRDDDAREVSEGWRARITDAIKAGETWAYRDSQGRLVILGGVAKLSNEIWSPWMLCSPLLEHHKVFVKKEARRVVQDLLTQMPVDASLCNLIPKDSPRNRAFIESLGFRIYTTPGEGRDVFRLSNHV